MQARGGRPLGGRIVGGLLLLFMIVILGGLAYLRSWPPIVLVMSPSMEPAIETGAVVLLRHLENPPRVGDVVAIPVPDQARANGYPDEVLHRVIEVTQDGLVRTKGDNMQNPDPFAVPLSSVDKRAVVVVPGAGRMIAFLASPYGLLWLASGVLLFAFAPFFDSHRRLVAAVEEYGYHLTSHTQIVRSMSTASQHLAATVVGLRSGLANTPDPGGKSRSRAVALEPGLLSSPHVGSHPEPRTAARSEPVVGGAEDGTGASTPTAPEPSSPPDTARRETVSALSQRVAPTPLRGVIADQHRNRLTLGLFADRRRRRGGRHRASSRRA